MDGGRISAAVGTHAELMQSSEIYREVYTTQNKAGIRMQNKEKAAASSRARPRPVTAQPVAGNSCAVMLRTLF